MPPEQELAGTDVGNGLEPNASSYEPAVAAPVKPRSLDIVGARNWFFLASLVIIIPGITLVVVGFLRVGAVATIPGGIVTMLGVVLAYCNSTGDWPFWAYGWSLVVPFGIGLGMYLQALRDRDQHALRSGRTLLFISLIIFLIGFVLFESILGISGRDYFGPVGKAALPVLLILVGIILLVRSVQRSRHA